MTILGGGRHFFIPEEMGGKRSDLNLLEEIESSHTILTKKSDIEASHSNRGKMVGLFADEASMQRT